jgi:hypothetical protein
MPCRYSDSRLRRAEGRIFAIGLPPGPIEKIAENIFDADWSPDGARLAVMLAVAGAQQLEFPEDGFWASASGSAGKIATNSRGHSARSVPSAAARARSNAAFEKKLELIAKAARQGFPRYGVIPMVDRQDLLP